MVYAGFAISANKDQVSWGSSKEQDHGRKLNNARRGDNNNRDGELREKTASATKETERTKK